MSRIRFALRVVTDMLGMLIMFALTFGFVCAVYLLATGGA